MVKVIAATSALVACVVDAAKYTDPDDFYSSSFAVEPDESSLVQLGIMGMGGQYDTDAADNNNGLPIQIYYGTDAADNDITNGGACSGSQCQIRVCCPGTHTYDFTGIGDICGDSNGQASCATSAECESFADFELPRFCNLGCAATSDPDAVCVAAGFGDDSKCLLMTNGRWGCYADADQHACPQGQNPYDVVGLGSFCQHWTTRAENPQPASVFQDSRIG